MLGAAALVLAGCSSDGAADQGDGASPGVERVIPGSAFEGIEFEDAPETIIVGVVLDATGPNRAVEEAIGDAILEAATEINEGDLPLGQAIELRVFDTGSDVDRALDAIGRLVNVDASAVIVGCDAEVAAPVATRASGQGMLAVSACATTADVSSAAGELVFNLGLDAEVQGRLLAESALAAEWDSVATVSGLADAASDATCSAFETFFSGAGGVTRTRLEVGDGATTPVEVASSIERFARVDGVVLCLDPGAVPDVAKRVRDTFEQAILVSASGADAMGTGDAADVDNVFWLAASTDAADTPMLHLAGRSAMEAIVTAIEQADSEVPAEIAAALRGFDDVDLALGKTTFDRDTQVRRPLDVAFFLNQGGSASLVGRWSEGGSVVPTAPDPPIDPPATTLPTLPPATRPVATAPPATRPVVPPAPPPTDTGPTTTGQPGGSTTLPPASVSPPGASVPAGTTSLPPASVSPPSVVSPPAAPSPPPAPPPPTDTASQPPPDTATEAQPNSR